MASPTSKFGSNLERQRIRRFASNPLQIPPFPNFSSVFTKRPQDRGPELERLNTEVEQWRQNFQTQLDQFVMASKLDRIESQQIVTIVQNITRLQQELTQVTQQSVGAAFNAKSLWDTINALNVQLGTLAAQPDLIWRREGSGKIMPRIFTDNLGLSVRPQGKFHTLVNALNRTILDSFSYVASAAARILLRRGRGTGSEPSGVATGDSLGMVEFYGQSPYDELLYGGIEGFEHPAVQIEALAEDDPYGTPYGYVAGSLHLRTSDGGSAVQDALVINADQTVTLLAVPNEPAATDFLVHGGTGKISKRTGGADGADGLGGPGPNLVVNPSFEDPTWNNGWIVDVGEMETSTVFHGSTCIKTVAIGTLPLGARSNAILVSTDLTYQVSAWLKATVSNGGYYIFVACYSDVDGTTFISALQLSGTVTTSDWAQFFSVIGPGHLVNFPDGTKSIRVFDGWISNSGSPVGTGHADAWQVIVIDSDDSTVYPFNIGVGREGDAGTDGKTVRTGSGAPSDSLGVAGDFYYDPATYLMYGPKTTTWPAGVTLKGPKGDDGAPGAGSSGEISYEIVRGITPGTGQVLIQETSPGSDVWYLDTVDHDGNSLIRLYIDPVHPEYSGLPGPSTNLLLSGVAVKGAGEVVRVMSDINGGIIVSTEDSACATAAERIYGGIAGGAQGWFGNMSTCAFVYSAALSRWVQDRPMASEPGA